jgi:hypothetical protein
MNLNSIKNRVSRLKKQIESFAQSPEHRFKIEFVNSQTIDLLKSKEYFPKDMLLILEEIGCMRDWNRNDCFMLDWWIPTSIELSNTENRCVYSINNSNFTNPTYFLFFAQDCDGKSYFYDTSVTPWKVIICDALSTSYYNESPKNYHEDFGDWDGLVVPYEELESIDVLTIIENWAFNS